jgi:hypothetical protein
MCLLMHPDATPSSDRRQVCMQAAYITAQPASTHIICDGVQERKHPRPHARLPLSQPPPLRTHRAPPHTVCALPALPVRHARPRRTQPPGQPTNSSTATNQRPPSSHVALNAHVPLERPKCAA